MNKKFTMMLAAFVAAGYTITAEAGVVKVSKPTAAGKVTYVIGNELGTSFLATNGEAGSGGTLVTSTTLKEWNIENADGNSLTIVSKDATDGVKYDSDAFTYATNANTSVNLKFEAVGGNESALLLKGTNGEEKYLKFAEANAVEAVEKEDATELYFYAKGVAITGTGALKIGDRYVVSEDAKTVKLVSFGEYLSMAKPTQWEAEATTGELKVTVGTTTGYLLLSKTEAPTLTTAKEGASQFEVANGKLTVTNNTGVNFYVTSDMKLTTEVSKSVAGDNLATVSVPTAPTGNVADNALSGFPAKSIFVVYENKNAFGAFDYVVMNDKSLTTVNSYSKDKKFYWSMLNGTITNEAGGVFFATGTNVNQQSFALVPIKDKNAFYLVTSDGSYVTYTSSSKTFSLSTTNTDAAVFSAVEAGTTSIDAIELNKDTQGAFSVTYKYGETTAEDNLFDNVTAIEVEGTDADGKYVAGTYFVTSAPSALNLEEAYVLTDEDDKKALNAMTFVAAHPSNKYFTEKNDGKGVKFTTVKGSDLVKEADAAKNKITANNAAFTMYESDINEGKLIFKLAKANLYNASTDKMYVSGQLTVTAAEYGDKAVVTTSNTVTDYMFATLGSENIVEYEDFLTADRQVYNIQFMSTKLATDGKDKTESEYMKYLGLGANTELVAQGSDFVDLNAPQNQWVVSNMTKENVVTFQNREGGQTFSAKLVKTDKDDVYRLANVTAEADALSCKFVDENGAIDYTDDAEIQANMLVKLVPVTVDMMAGYASDELDNLGLVKISFNIDDRTTAIKLYLNATGTDNNTIELNKDKSTQFEIVKFEADTIFHVNKYAYLNDKKEIKQEEEDKIAVITYAFKQYRTDGKEAYLNADLNGVKVLTTNETAEEDAQRFLVKINKNGSYSLIAVDATDEFTDVVNNAGETYDITYSTTTAADVKKDANIYADHASQFLIEGEAWNASYNHVPQHVMFQNGNNYMAVSEAGAAIMEAPSALKAEYTKADLTFWLDTTDNKAAVPTFYISKGAKEYMFNATDSLQAYNEGTASAEDVKDYMMPGYTTAANAEARAIFRAATLKDSKTLVTSIDGKETELTKAEDLANYQYKIVLKDEATADEYVVRSLNGYTYLYETNGQLGFTVSKDKAIVFTIERVEAPTSNEGVSATEVKVVANNGSVVVKNAAGKNVVVSTILGQVVANEVLISDNATINVPAGIVVVAVEGESFKVNVK